MKEFLFLFSFFFSFFAYSIENNGGVVYFGGYVFEEPCYYNTTDSQITLICSERENDKHHSYQLLSLDENKIKIDSVKVSDIYLSKISVNSAVTTISYR